jgi:hypothetical protein
MIISTPETLITITPESPITIIGIHKEVKDFRVGPGGPAREQIKQAEHQDSAQESVQEVKDRGPHHKGEKEESPLRPQKGERVIERPENGITSSFHRRASKGITLNSALRKEPGHEVDGAHGHADAKNDSGHRPLRAAFSKREH